MICLNTRYFNINRLLLLTVGLWPYEQSKITRLQLICLYSILISYIIFQLTAFLTSECTPQFIIEVLSSATSFTVFVVNYNSYSFNISAVKRLLELLQFTYDKLKDKKEIAIIEEYGNTGKRYTILLTLTGVCSTFLFTIFSFWPSVLEIVSPTNESQLHAQLITTEYFIDPEKYLFLILLHAVAAIWIGGISLVAIGSTTVAFSYFQCGIFKVASYRIKRAMTVYTVEANSVRNENVVRRGFVYAVEMHRTAMRLVKVYISQLEVTLLLIIVIGIISSSLNLFREVSTGLEFRKIILPFTFLNTCFMFGIVSNYCAQKIMDYNDQVFFTVYNVEWYEAPLAIQKMTLFMLQRGNKPFHVNLGGVFIGSLESAAKLMSTSLSYFTVLYSTRQNM